MCGGGGDEEKCGGVEEVGCGPVLGVLQSGMVMISRVKGASV